VINRGSLKGSYCACFEFEIRDGKGSVSGIHLSGTQSAKAIYGSDVKEIQPGESSHTLMVFDISLKSSYYVLAPGSLYESELPGLILNVP
jgi:hypothetical protein